jgi:hypothetical protein
MAEAHHFMETNEQIGKIVVTAPTIRRFLQLKRTVTNLGDIAWEGLTMPVVRAETRVKERTQQLLFRSPIQRTKQQPCEITACSDGYRCSMGDTGTLASIVNSQFAGMLTEQAQGASVNRSRRRMGLLSRKRQSNPPSGRNVFLMHGCMCREPTDTRKSFISPRPVKRSRPVKTFSAVSSSERSCLSG